MRTRFPGIGTGFALGALLLSALLPTAVAAKPVETYLHGSAAMYIQGRHQEAGVEIEEGLRKYPNDSRLKALADQLKKMKDQKKQDQGQSGQGGDQNQDKKEKQDSTGQGNQDGKQDEKDKDKKKDQGKEKEKPEEDKNKDKEQGKGEHPPDPKPSPEDKKDGDAPGQAESPAKPGEMSKEEAERLLNSYQDDEKREQKNQRRQKPRPVEIEKDW